MPLKPSIKEGDVFSKKEGGVVVVKKYIRYDKILVEHQDDVKYISCSTAQNIKSGSVSNPYLKNVCGVGYRGVGPYNSQNSKGARQTWTNMLKRVYDPRELKKAPTYIGCSVCEEWHNFQNFAEWYHKQPNAEKKGFDLDKDLMVWGNKVYGPDACSFVPHLINSLLTNNGKSKGECPKGVKKNNGSFIAEMSTENGSIRSKTVPTVEEACRLYKKMKEDRVREVAERNKDLIHPTVYQNLMDWKLEEYIEGC